MENNIVSSLTILSLGYALLGALLLISTLYSRLAMATKLGLVIIVSASYISTYLAWLETQGWPTQQPPPDQFLLLGTQVQEPNRKTDQPGAIYLWGLPDSGVTPRAYQLPYSVPQHEDVESARQMLEEGKTVVAERKQSDDGSSGGSGNGGGYRFEQKTGRLLPPKSSE